MNYDTYASRCYEQFKEQIDACSALELPQLILNRISRFSYGNLACSKILPLSLRYMDIIAITFAIGHRMQWMRSHSDYFLDERVPQTCLGFSARWSFLTVNLLHALIIKASHSSLNTAYASLLNSIIATSKQFCGDESLDEVLAYMERIKK